MDSLTVEVIKWVNTKRKQYGLPEIHDLALGKRVAASDCPIANSLSGQLDFDRIKGHIYNTFEIEVVDSEGQHVRTLERGDTPRFVVNWIHRFDKEEAYRGYNVTRSAKAS